MQSPPDFVRLVHQDADSTAPLVSLRVLYDALQLAYAYRVSQLAIGGDVALMALRSRQAEDCHGVLREIERVYGRPEGAIEL